MKEFPLSGGKKYWGGEKKGLIWHMERSGRGKKQTAHGSGKRGD